MTGRVSRAAASRAGAPPRASSGERRAPRLSDEREAWLRSDGVKSLGGLIDVFEKRAFALAFVILLAVPALPLPTGGATHVFELIAILLALQLIIGRDEIWLPQRWRARTLTNDGRFVSSLLRAIRRLERVSRPRLRLIFGHRLSNAVFGLLVAGGSLAAFLAPPFTGLDTLRALGVVLLSLGVLFEDAVLAIAGVLVVALGVVLELIVGGAAVHVLTGLL